MELSSTQNSYQSWGQDTLSESCLYDQVVVSGNLPLKEHLLLIELFLDNKISRSLFRKVWIKSAETQLVLTLLCASQFEGRLTAFPSTGHGSAKVSALMPIFHDMRIISYPEIPQARCLHLHVKAFDLTYLSPSFSLLFLFLPPSLPHDPITSVLTAL